MRKILIMCAFALSACGAQTPLVRDGDLKAEAEKAGYSSVLILRERSDCGRGLRGSKAKAFIGKKNDKTYTGKVCYWKANGKAHFRVDVIGEVPSK